jgi:hypothetical protein
MIYEYGAMVQYVKITVAIKLGKSRDSSDDIATGCGLAG